MDFSIPQQKAIDIRDTNVVVSASAESGKTAVLVDRNHKKYPVKADFKGLSLSTSLQEHIQVVFEENNSYAYLS